MSSIPFSWSRHYAAWQRHRVVLAAALTVLVADPGAVARLNGVPAA